MWRVAYTPGTLRAVSRKEGRVWATAEVRTAGAPVRVALAPDRARLRANGDDLSFVTVTVQDRAGALVPTAEPLIRFSLSGGDARIVGVDNGDPTSHTSFKANQVRLFSGKALVIIRAGTRPGTVTLTAAGDGLTPSAVRLQLR